MKLPSRPRAPRIDPISAALAATVVVLVVAFVLLLNSTTPDPTGRETSITDVTTSPRSTG
ncbi:MAG: hypothetical protein JHC95_21080 [Solirubrobacteraceae bacterium]|nr:hypothetical protein [Solirubrobacteraceae bacterium]